jgi:pilus assembly protein CpaB
MSILKNRTVIGSLCILLSLAICFGVAPMFNKSVSQTAEIVRVTREIKAGDVITADMVAVEEVGGYNLPEGIIRQTDTVVGKYAAADLSAGDYILPAKLSETPAAENAYLYSLDGTQQAISVTIKTFAAGLSGKLQSGDIVSVIAPDYRKQGMTVIPAELQYVEVISVTASSGYDANTGEAPDEDEDERELPSTVTLLVSIEQSKALAELEADGKLHLSLVYRGTPENAALFIAAQEKVITALYPAAAPAEEGADDAGGSAPGNTGAQADGGSAVDSADTHETPGTGEVDE